MRKSTIYAMAMASMSLASTFTEPKMVKLPNFNHPKFKGKAAPTSPKPRFKKGSKR